MDDAKRIIGAGVLLAFAGEEHRLRFGFGALEVVEEQFDGLLNFTEALNGGYRGRRLKAVRVGLQAGAGLPRAHAEELVGRLIGSADFVKEMAGAVAAISAAFDEAIPPPPKTVSASKVSGRGKGSHGPASSAARSANLASSPKSSAA